MALTRKFLAALGVEGAIIDEIINAHTETVDGLKDELARVKADAEKLPQVQKELDDMKAAEEKRGKDPYRVKYEALKEDFENFKQDIADKAARATKSAAYRTLLQDAGVADKRIDAVLRVTDLDGIELDDDGKIKNAESLSASIKEEWSDFIETKPGSPVRVDTGGSLQGQRTSMTVDEIMAIEDDAARQNAIAENHTLFGF